MKIVLGLQKGFSIMELSVSFPNMSGCYANTDINVTGLLIKVILFFLVFFGIKSAFPLPKIPVPSLTLSQFSNEQ